MSGWLDLYPERLAHEIAGLSELGFEPDDGELKRARRLVMSGERDTVMGRVALTIVYPDTFPFARPEVFAPGLRLERHQNPYEGNLCLLDGGSGEWSVTDTGAWLISEQVPHLLALFDAGPEAMRSGEAPQGEPQSSYFRGLPGAAIFLPSAALAVDPEAFSGRLELSFGPAEPPTSLRALLARVTTKGGRHGLTLAEAEPALRERFSGPSIEGRWVRLERLPRENTEEALLLAAIESDERLANTRYQSAGPVEHDVIGCVFREEVTQGQWEDSWLFVVRTRQRTGPRRARQRITIVNSDRLTRDDLAARAPVLAGLEGKTVAIAGLGALGSTVAIELARSGVGELRLLDHDRVEVGNTARWPIGLSAVGHRKVDAVAGWIRQEFPFTRLWGREWRIGLTETPARLGSANRVDEMDVLEEFWSCADLIIDATAELGVQHLISTLAAPKPTLYAWATQGAAGGTVAHVAAGGGCWLCLQHALADGTVPMAPSEGEAQLQPRGCATRTFTGSMFDLAPIANQAVRVAARALLGQLSVDEAVSVCSNQGPDGRPLPAPSWTHHELRVHAECSACVEELAA